MLTKVGIEFETEFLKRNTDLPSVFSKTHDASIETPVKKSIFFYEEDTDSNSIVGVEIVSTPLNIFNYENIQKNLNELVRVLIKNGEKEKSYRAGIHIHIDFTEFELQHIKNALALGLMLEPVFYLFGSFGYRNRGIFNDFTYCRSLHNPPVVNFNGEYVSVYEPEKLLGARTIPGFFKYMGINIHDSPRYHPARYFWLNLYSSVLHGTLEFRVFNKTFNTSFIIAAIELCRRFVEACVREDRIVVKQYNSIYNTTKFETIQLFKQMNSEYLFIPDEYSEIILKVMKISPQIIARKEAIKTHLRRYDLVYPQTYRPPVISNVRDPRFVDIHVLRGE